MPLRPAGENSPYLNRFLSPYPIIQDPYNPIDWDRYQYARSNPVNFNDPTGYDVDCTSGESGCRRRVWVEQAESLLTKLANKKEPVTWDNLSKKEQNTLRNVGWDPADYDHSDYVIPSGKDIAGTSQDPVVWLVALISAGKLTPPTIAFAKELINSWGVVNLYRAVGAGELADVIQNRVIRPDPNGMSMDGKWFTNSAELAAQWGQRFSNWTGKAFTVIEVGVPQSVVKQMQYAPSLDGIGPAWYAEGPVLDTLNQFLRYINVVQ